MSTHVRSIAKSALVVASGTFMSRLLGFARDMVTAYALGAGWAADAFFVAFRIPNLLRNLFGEGSMTMAFVPVFTRTRKESGEDAAQAMARAALAWLVVILGALTLLAEVGAGAITRLMAPGFADNPAAAALTTELLRITFPFALSICAVALCMGILNASGRFLAPALAPCVLNLCLIAAGLGAVFLALSVPHALAWAVLVAGVLQWLLQQPFLRRIGFSWRGPWRWRDPGVVRTARLMVPTLFGAAVYQLNIVLGTVMASFLAEGSISFLYYADRVVQFPLGVFGVAVSTAALPSLAALAVSGQGEEFKRTLNAGLKLSLFICLPATAGLLALSEPVTRLLFGRGAFDPAAVEATSRAMFAYALGLPAFAQVRPLVAAYYAQEDTRTPVKVAACCLLVFAGLGLALMGPLGHVGLALAASASSWANALMLSGLLARRIGPWRDYLGGSLSAALLSLGLGLGAWATAPLGPWAVALIPLWAALYILAARLARVPEAMLLTDALRRRVARKGD